MSKPSIERQAAQELIDAWDLHIPVPPNHWERAEQRATKLVATPSMAGLTWKAAAACIILALSAAAWLGTSEEHCASFACLWETHQNTPLTEQELDLLEAWESDDYESFF